MKNIDLPFRIGDHYENLEFDLEPLETERIKGFDSYLYIREIVFLGAIPRYVELIFSWDILQIVMMTFEFNSLEQQNDFKDVLDKMFAKIRQNRSFNIDEKVELRLICKPNSSNVIIIYGYTTLINNLTTIQLPL